MLVIINKMEVKMQNKNEYYMQLAINQAKIANKKEEVPIGAVIIKDGKVISDITKITEDTDETETGVSLYGSNLIKFEKPAFG